MQTILIAEGNGDLRGLPRPLPESSGYAVLEAAGGRAAVEAAVSGRPRIVIMGVGMPGLGGGAAGIRGHADTAGTPTLTLSAYDTLEQWSIPVRGRSNDLFGASYFSPRMPPPIHTVEILNSTVCRRGARQQVRR